MNPLLRQFTKVKLPGNMGKPSVIMLFLGFSAGLPILLIFSSLSLWLREAGVQRSSVTFFAWAALGYSFKFLWAPLVDQISLPFLTRTLGRRRSWMLASQICTTLAMVCMACTNPASQGHALTIMALASVVLGFSSATQDIVIDAYRIESAPESFQAMMAATYIAGYRIGMIAAGAGALILADIFGSAMGNYHYAAWQYTYLCMALLMGVGIITTLVISEPATGTAKEYEFSPGQYAGVVGIFAAAICAFIAGWYLGGFVLEKMNLSFMGILKNPVLFKTLAGCIKLAAGSITAYFLSLLLIRTGLANQNIIRESYLSPVQDFFHRYGMKTAVILLALVGCYRLSDIVLGVISNVFYQDLGFTKTQIAGVVKTFGLAMTIAGGFLGGIFSARYKIIHVLFAGALLSALTNLLFMVQASLGAHMGFLYLVISADNLAAGLAGAAFVAFLSSLTSVRFTAVQYAIFSSVMTLFPKILGGWSGTMVDALGYSRFFLTTTLMGLPVLVLVWAAASMLSQKD